MNQLRMLVPNQSNHRQTSPFQLMSPTKTMTHHLSPNNSWCQNRQQSPLLIQRSNQSFIQQYSSDQYRNNQQNKNQIYKSFQSQRLQLDQNENERQDMFLKRTKFNQSRQPLKINNQNSKDSKDQGILNCLPLEKLINKVKLNQINSFHDTNKKVTSPSFHQDQSSFLMLPKRTVDSLQKEIKDVEGQISGLQNKKLQLQVRLDKMLNSKNSVTDVKCNLIEIKRQPKTIKADEIHFETTESNIMNDVVASPRFVGHYVDGLKQGYGSLFDCDDQIIYEGEWSGDAYEGRGRLQNANAKQQCTNSEFLENAHSMKLSQDNESAWTTYEGDFKGGKFHGLGILHIQKKLKFHGSFKDGVASGRGTFVNTDEYDINYHHHHSRKVQLVGQFEGGYITSMIVCNQ